MRSATCTGARTHRLFVDPSCSPAPTTREPAHFPRVLLVVTVAEVSVHVCFAPSPSSHSVCFRTACSPPPPPGVSLTMAFVAGAPLCAHLRAAAARRAAGRLSTRWPAPPVGRAAAAAWGAPAGGRVALPRMAASSENTSAPGVAASPVAAPQMAGGGGGGPTAPVTDAEVGNRSFQLIEMEDSEQAVSALYLRAADKGVDFGATDGPVPDSVTGEWTLNEADGTLGLALTRNYEGDFSFSVTRFYKVRLCRGGRGEGGTTRGDRVWGWPRCISVVLWRLSHHCVGVPWGAHSLGACPLRVACSSDAWKLNQFFCRRWGAVPPAFPLYGTLFTLCPSPVYFGLHHHRATMSGARAPPLSPSKATSSRRSTQWSRKTRWASSASSPPPTTCRQRTMTSPSRAPTEHAPLPPPPPPAVRLPSILSGLLSFLLLLSCVLVSRGLVIMRHGVARAAGLCLPRHRNAYLVCVRERFLFPGCVRPSGQTCAVPLSPPCLVIERGGRRCVACSTLAAAPAVAPSMRHGAGRARGRSRRLPGAWAQQGP